MWIAPGTDHTDYAGSRGSYNAFGGDFCVELDNSDTSPWARETTMPTIDRICANPDHAMQIKRIKRDFSSDYRDAQLKRDDVLRENSQKVFELGMS